MSVLQDILAIYDAKIRIHQHRKNGRPFENTSGVDHTSISNWRSRKSGARLANAEAVANALGYRLVLEKIKLGEAA